MTDHVDSLQIEPLSQAHQRDRFDCGNPSLNEYLQRYARQNDQKNLTKTFVAVDDDSRALGYYSISSSSVEFEELPSDIAKVLPRYPVPAALIGKFATDRTIQGQGLGARLLIDALQRIISISEDMGIMIVIVDAIDQDAKEFYLHYGFLELVGHDMKLFLPIETIRQLF